MSTIASEVDAADKKASKADLDNDLSTISVPGLIAEGGEIEFRDFLALIFATSSAIQASRRMIARKFGLSATELAVFLAVQKLEGMPSIWQIAQHLRVSATNVTTDINRLAKAGLVNKQPHPHDARALQIQITPEGNALLARLIPILREANNRSFARMTHLEMATLTRVMEQVIQASGEFSSEWRQRLKDSA